ncbi:DUF308 domain-containing protein [Dactylosporangium sp. NPDC051485]|uniref:HdeD family acid-resistance protein n=1 Tax=Dactylosporangium sp. NPDC051485 TaxID=3154846 RepID=UPI0034345663
MTTASGHPSTAGTMHGPVEVPFWQLVAAGVITALFGVAVLVWPAATLRLLGVLAGIWLVVMGLSRVVGVFRAGHGTTMRHLVDGAFGLVLLVLGVACLRSTGTAVVALSVLIGLAWLVSGFAELLLGMSAHGRPRTWLLTLGGVSIAVGIVFFAWPGISLTSLILLTGITALVLGAVEVGVALQARREVAAH